MRRSKVVDRIEEALRATPFCPCGEHTDIVAVDGTIILRCSAIDRPRSRLERLLGSVVAPSHVSHPIIERVDTLAA
ncbi:MAG TPA: hypothetical protein VJZ72_01680 [Candidatus Limnocylindrales bacterium]|nr:hypothetical protein [Candidatus Limnocylindrales bacterium]